MKIIKNRIKISSLLFLKTSIVRLLIIFCFLKVKNKGIRNNYLFVLMTINIIIFNFDVYKRKIEVRMLKLIGVSKNKIILELFVEYLFIEFIEMLFLLAMIHVKKISIYPILNYMLIQYVISLITVFISTNYLLSKKKEEVMVDE